MLAAHSKGGMEKEKRQRNVTQGKQEENAKVERKKTRCGNKKRETDGSLPFLVRLKRKKTMKCFEISPMERQSFKTRTHTTYRQYLPFLQRMDGFKI